MSDFNKTARQVAESLLNVPLLEQFLHPPEEIERDLLELGVSLADMDLRSRQALGMFIGSLALHDADVPDEVWTTAVKAFALGWYIGRQTEGTLDEI
jgi:hypothetical protein